MINENNILRKQVGKAEVVEKRYLKKLSFPKDGDFAEYKIKSYSQKES